MLLKRPKEFERVARQWAVIYAGAPAKDTAGPAEATEEVQASIVNEAQ